MAGLIHKVRKLWKAVAGPGKLAQPEVTVFDPDAERAHDLDDPFYDDQVRSRIAGVIASTGNRKTKNTF
jgi:hypothetical protein